MRQLSPCSSLSAESSLHRSYIHFSVKPLNKGFLSNNHQIHTSTVTSSTSSTAVQWHWLWLLCRQKTKHWKTYFKKNGQTELLIGAQFCADSVVRNFCTFGVFQAWNMNTEHLAARSEVRPSTASDAAASNRYRHTRTSVQTCFNHLRALLKSGPVIFRSFC